LLFVPLFLSFGFSAIFSICSSVIPERVVRLASCRWWSW
jgi:hypothetical protein